MHSSLRKKYIGNAAFYKMALAVAVPIMIQNGITNFVSLLDNIMVGRVGTEQMTGVAIVNQLIFVFNLAIFGAVSGAGIFGAQYYGKGDWDGVRQTFRFKLLVCTALTVLGAGIFLLFGEALVITNDSLKPHFRNMIKQRGGMFAKGFLFGTQFKAYFKDDLWLSMARHAVSQAQRIQAAAIEKGYSLYAVSPTNQVFLVLSHAQIERLKQDFAFELNGHVDKDHEAARFVCSWATRPEAVDALIAAL